MVHEVNHGAIGICDQLKAQVIGLLHDTAMLGFSIAMGLGRRLFQK